MLYNLYNVRPLSKKPARNKAHYKYITALPAKLRTNTSSSTSTISFVAKPRDHIKNVDRRKLRVVRSAAPFACLHGMLRCHGAKCILPPKLPSLPPPQVQANIPKQRFIKDGCPNCEPFLNLQGNMDAIIDCTSQVFEGLITLADPQRSWVAKWQRLDGYVKGVYATKVSGQLPDEVIGAMEEAGMRYIPRDGTATDDD